MINNINVAEADSVKIVVKRNLIFARFQEHVRAPDALVNGNVEQNITLTEAMARVKELL